MYLWRSVYIFKGRYIYSRVGTRVGTFSSHHSCLIYLFSLYLYIIINKSTDPTDPTDPFREIENNFKKYILDYINGLKRGSVVGRSVLSVVYKQVRECPDGIFLNMQIGLYKRFQNGGGHLLDYTPNPRPYRPTLHLLDQPYTLFLVLKNYIV